SCYPKKQAPPIRGYPHDNNAGRAGGVRPLIAHISPLPYVRMNAWLQALGHWEPPMIVYILAVSLFALQGAASPGGQNSDSSSKPGAHRKQSGSERNSGRPRLAHPPGPSQEIRLLNLVPKSPAFSVIGLQTKDYSAGSQQSAAAGQGSPSDPGS